MSRDRGLSGCRECRMSGCSGRSPLPLCLMVSLTHTHKHTSSNVCAALPHAHSFTLTRIHERAHSNGDTPRTHAMCTHRHMHHAHILHAHITPHAHTRTHTHTLCAHFACALSSVKFTTHIHFHTSCARRLTRTHRFSNTCMNKHLQPEPAALIVFTNWLGSGGTCSKIL